MILDVATARKTAEAFVTAWNSHDDIALLGMFRDDATMSGPLLYQLLKAEDGVLRGKDAIANYLRMIMTQLPHVCFDVKCVYAGVGGFAMHCSTIFNKDALETFELDEKGKIVRWAAYYSSLELP